MKANIKKTGSRRGMTLGGVSQRRVRPLGLKTSRKSRRGFAAMDPALQRRIARQGGRAVSRNRKHMAAIGRIGGERSHGARRR